MSLSNSTTNRKQTLIYIWCYNSALFGYERTYKIYTKFFYKQQILAKILNKQSGFSILNFNLLTLLHARETMKRLLLVRKHIYTCMTWKATSRKWRFSFKAWCMSTMFYCKCQSDYLEILRGDLSTRKLHLNIWQSSCRIQAVFLYYCPDCL